MMTDEEILALHEVIAPARPARRRSADAPLSVVMGRIADAVARMSHQGSRNMLLSARRDKQTAFARQLAMYLCREVTHASFPTIGKFFGRDHSTVVHGCRIVAARIAARPEFAAKVDALALDLKQMAGPFWEAAA